MGRLIPAGTGRKEYDDLKVVEDDLKTLQAEVAARKAAEEEAMAAVATKAETQAQSIIEEGKVLFPEDGVEGETVASQGDGEAPAS